MSPFNAFMFIQGLETVALRMREHCSNAAVVAEYLTKHRKVDKVIFPGLMSGEPRRRAEAYLKRDTVACSASSSRAAETRGASSSTA
jgi:O-acetylhomoserine (thiol)-lyase